MSGLYTRVSRPRDRTASRLHSYIGRLISTVVCCCCTSSSTLPLRFPPFFSGALWNFISGPFFSQCEVRGTLAKRLCVEPTIGERERDALNLKRSTRAPPSKSIQTATGSLCAEEINTIRASFLLCCSSELSDSFMKYIVLTPFIK